MKNIFIILSLVATTAIAGPKWLIVGFKDNYYNANEGKRKKIVANLWNQDGSSESATNWCDSGWAPAVKISNTNNLWWIYLISEKQTRHLTPSEIAAFKAFIADSNQRFVVTNDVLNAIRQYGMVITNIP